MSRRSTLSLAVIVVAAFATAGAAEARRFKFSGGSGAASRDIGPSTMRVNPRERRGGSLLVVPVVGSNRGGSGPTERATPRSLLDTPDLPATAATPAGPALVNDARETQPPVARAQAYGFREVTGGGGFEALSSSDRPFGSPAPTLR